MYVLEEYLAVIILAIALGIAGMAVVVLVLMVHEEGRLLDRALLTGSFALPHSWPKLWAVIKIAERWQRFSVSSSQKVRRVFRRLDIVS